MPDTPEVFLGILLWMERDLSRGCLSDLNGQTWIFKAFHLDDSRQQVSVYQDWTPQISIRTNPRTGNAFVLTEPTIVEFEIKVFHYPDGRDGYKIVSVQPATNVGARDAETLNLIRERFEMAARAERRQRYERREQLATRELGFKNTQI
jgi:hypothetical protein